MATAGLSITMFKLHIAVILWFMSPTNGLRTVPQYARDFSEHCKRRDALPSVFLSRRVMEADAQVLHFTKLDMPYSCFTTVRTEPGHSIIMVVETSPVNLQEEYCNEGYQLGVFEFAETFGGYWGPIPDAVLKMDPKEPVYTKQYTLATKPPPATASTTKSTLGVPSTTLSSSGATATTQDFITIDVPLVNLSASLVPIETQDQKPFDVDEFFDLFYDVAPRPGQEYKTSILPLVQIAVKKQDDLREGDGEPRYELDYVVGQFTPDRRLTTPARSTHINTNRNSNQWKKKKLQDRRLDQNKNYSLHTRGPLKSRKLNQYSLPTTNHRPSYDHISKAIAGESEFEDVKQKPYHLIDAIMKSLNDSGDLTTQEQSTNSVLAIFNKWENNYRNLSVYLAPYSTSAFLPVSDLPITRNVVSEIFLQVTKESILRKTNKPQDVLENTRINTNTFKREQSFENPNDANTLELEVASVTTEEIKKPTIETDTVTQVKPTSSLMTGPSRNPRVKTSFHEIQGNRWSLEATQLLEDNILIPVITTERSLSGTLVDHESWENVVQSAPVMAGLLNQHGPELSSSSNFKPSDLAARNNTPRIRRKRHISAIMVDEARPHRRPTTTLPAVRPSVFNAIDVHELARLIELPDDQMNNHVAIKMNPKASKSLFNVCSPSHGKKTRFLVVFNTSRIIMSIFNFTIPHVMVALTTARPLALMEQQCPDKLVECQVEGTRFCIDNTNACDGVPNCGSAYAYDEDRVLCGVIDRQRSVYLAAGTCLAVLVTMLYITHYWLRRCVPNVAEAFFVYYDSADNELYLDSIMRSPMDTDGDQYLYNSALFDEENMIYSQDTGKSTNFFKRMLSFLFKKDLFKQQQPSKDLQPMQGVGRSLSREVPHYNKSFTESELLSMMSAGRDQEVQTGESLEMAYLKAINSIKKDEPGKKTTKQRRPSVHSIVLRDLLGAKITDSLDTSLDSPGPSERTAGPMLRPGLEEKEIHSTLYDPGSSKIPKPRATHGKKCLRFNEKTTFIPRDDDEDDDLAEVEESSTAKGSNKKNYNNNTEHGGSDFRKFFRKKKDHK